MPQYFPHFYLTFFAGVLMPSHLWSATIHLTPSLATELIRDQFQLPVSHCVILGEGFDNTAYLVDHQYIFRFPRRNISTALLQNEIDVLPYLAQHLSFPVPVPSFIGKATEAYPYPFAGYRLIEGRPLNELEFSHLNLSSCAFILGKWLRELHQIPLLEAHSHLLGGEQLWRLNPKNRQDRCSQLLDRYETCFQKSGFNTSQLRSLLHQFPEFQFNLDNSCYLHGDLYCKHVLVDDQVCPTGLIDWGDTHIGHPGIDLSVAYLLFEKAEQELFFDTYGEVNPSTRFIAAFRAFWHPFIALAYAYEQEDLPLITWSEYALKNGCKALLKNL